MTAGRSVPDSTNAILPFDASAWQRDANEEIIALWKRICERQTTSSGTNDVITAQTATDVSVMAAHGPMLIVRPLNTNSGAVRINPDGLGLLNVVNSDGGALTAGQFVAGRDHVLLYDASAPAYRLIANGSAPAPTIAAPGPVKIDQQTASSSSTIAFTTGLNNTYDHYEIKFEFKPATDDVGFWLRVGTGAGPTYVTSASYSYGLSLNNNGSMTTSGASGDTKILMTNAGGGTSGVGNASGEKIVGSIKFANPEASEFMPIRFETAYTPAGNGMSGSYGTGGLVGVGPITGLRFEFSSGAIVSGIATLYGWPK